MKSQQEQLEGILSCSAPGCKQIRKTLVHVADPAAVTELPGLVPDAPTLRPADIYSEAAVPGSSAALDVGIMSPDACGAGSDCCEAMRQRKLRDYGAHLAGLAARGI